MENILALQSLRQDADTAFAGFEAAASNVSVGCCDYTVITYVITLVK